MNQINYFIISILLLVFVSCDDDTNFKKTQPILFNIDTTLLSNNLIFDNPLFSFKPPIGSATFDNEKKNSFKNSFSSDEKLLKQLFIKGYMFENSGIVISKLNENIIPQNYLELLKKKYNTQNINFDLININSIPADQYIITTDKLVSIIVFLKLETFYRIQFLSPLKEYHDKIRSIESSIGTIKKKG